MFFIGDSFDALLDLNMGLAQLFGCKIKFTCVSGLIISDFGVHCHRVDDEIESVILPAKNVWRAGIQTAFRSHYSDTRMFYIMFSECQLDAVSWQLSGSSCRTLVGSFPAALPNLFGSPAEPFRR